MTDEPRYCRAVSSRTGKPCKAQPMRGQQVCWSHGGASPQARAAAERRLAEAEAREQVDRMLHNARADPIDNPAAELLALLGKLRHAVEVAGEHVNALRKIDYADVNMVSRVSAVVALWHELAESLRRGLTDAAKLNLEERAQAFRESVVKREGDAVAALLHMVLHPLGIDLVNDTEARTVVAAALRGLDGTTLAEAKRTPVRQRQPEPAAAPESNGHGEAEAVEEGELL